MNVGNKLEMCIERRTSCSKFVSLMLSSDIKKCLLFITLLIGVFFSGREMYIINNGKVEVSVGNSPFRVHLRITLSLTVNAE